MKILFITDLHGTKSKYKKVHDIAKAENVNMVINGGDMLPTHPNFFIQDEFIQSFLDEYLNDFDREKIYYLGMAGNDDLITFDDLLIQTFEKYSYTEYIAQRWVKIGQFEFIGMNFITDLPFGLKDRARIDNDDFEFPKQIGKQLISSNGEIKEIKDWFAYARNLPTIEEELENLPEPENYRKTIYIFHMPPSNISLDVCSDASRVGSKAIFEFIKKRQPLFTLHGHIHESVSMSGKWYNKIGNTISIQPGQGDYHKKILDYVIVNLKTMTFERIETIID
ncbi:MAG: phosphoesterase [Candidatus Lokiarchaeota archaeon]|nr:phosphoesterase [Candidatus Lokiarchaeota archaeon]MBD3199102.1 phosphoesterase [Candidatus Lokiarchaeota archaeon]